MLVAENIHDKIQMGLRFVKELEEQRKGPQHQAIVQLEHKRSRRSRIRSHAAP